MTAQIRDKPLDAKAIPKRGNPNWIKGVPQNKNGSSVHKPVAILARCLAPKAMQALKNVVEKSTNDSARIAAAQAILDRAYGKPAQFTTDQAQAFKSAIDMSDDELATIAAAASNVVKLVG